jgi:rhamnosyltransferase
VTTPRVSIVLPTRDGAATLPAVLDAIARQQVNFAFEVVAVDSGSTDGTVALLQSRVDRVVTVPAGSFDHGLTRNLGIREARGEFVVLLVQDAVPVSDSWLAALTAPLFGDPRVAGAFARQLPRPEAGAVTRHYRDRWLASSHVPRTVSIASLAELDALDPPARLERCAFDNVCSCIRRSTWTQFPFRRTPIAEDVGWAKEVLLAGHTLAYVPAAQVTHSHDRSATYEFRRTYVLHRRLYELFRLRTIPTLPRLGRAIVSSLAAHRRCRRAEGRHLLLSGRAIALAFVWPLGQYLGALSAARGWKQGRSRTV